MKESLLTVPIITGSCLLTHEEIEQLKPETTIPDLERLCGQHPNADDLCHGVFSRRITPCKLYYWFETHEFANLVARKTKRNIPYGMALEVLIDEAHRIAKAFSTAPCITTRFLYTHEPVVSERLSQLAEKYSGPYLQMMVDLQEELGSEKPLLADDLRNMIRKTPGRCDFMRVVVTYSHEAIGEEVAVVMESIERHFPRILGDIHQSTIPRALGRIFDQEAIFYIPPKKPNMF